MCNRLLLMESWLGMCSAVREQEQQTLSRSSLSRSSLSLVTHRYTSPPPNSRRVTERNTTPLTLSPTHSPTDSLSQRASQYLALE